MNTEQAARRCWQEVYSIEFVGRFCAEKKRPFHRTGAENPEAIIQRHMDAMRTADKAEIERLESLLSGVVCHATGGLLAQTGYDLETYKKHIDDAVSRAEEKYASDLRAEVDRLRGENAGLRGEVMRLLGEINQPQNYIYTTHSDSVDKEREAREGGE